MMPCALIQNKKCLEIICDKVAKYNTPLLFVTTLFLEGDIGHGICITALKL